MLLLSSLRRHWILGGVAALSVLFAGCDPQKIDKLEEGMSTELDVMKQFGTPADIVRAADGTRIFEYPRQPEGRTNYFISIGPDGKMSALRQALHPKYFAMVQPGMGKDEVRQLLGRPAKQTPFPLKQQEDWDWGWLDGQTKKLFTVTFDLDGKVVKSGSIDDPRELYTGG